MADWNSLLNKDLRLDSGASLAIRARDAIRDLIVSGKVAPGEKLPSEVKLAKMLGVSQMTAREALMDLVRQNLIYRHVGQGSFVKESSRGKNILWVCGRDIFNDDLSPYYTFSFQCCSRELERHGYRLIPRIWKDAGCGHPLVPDAKECDSLSGFIFLACGSSHPLLVHAREKGLPHVHITNERSACNVVADDLPQGLGLAFDYFSGRASRSSAISVIGQGGLEKLTRKAFQSSLANDMALQFFGVDVGTRIRDVTKAGHDIAKYIMGSGSFPTALFILDDVLAMGVVDAILELPAAQVGTIDLAIRGSGQIVVPFPRPVPYLSISTEEEARCAVQMLLKQMDGGGKIKSRLLQYSLLMMKGGGVVA